MSRWLQSLLLLLLVLALPLGCKHGCSRKHGSSSGGSPAAACAKGRAHLVATLKRKMLIDAFVTKGSAKLDAAVTELGALLADMKKTSNGKLDYTVTVVSDDETKGAAGKAGLVESALTMPDERPQLRGYFGLAARYGEEIAALPFMTPGQGMEFWVANKIRELRDRGDGTKLELGVLGGHGEIGLFEPNLTPPDQGGASLGAILGQSFPFYGFHTVDLKGGTAAIEDTLDGLIIVQPAKELSDKEVQLIDDFVMKGKSLVVIAGAANVAPGDEAMTAKLDTHGLNRLIGRYGIEINKDVVLDYGSSFVVESASAPGDAGTTKQAFPQFPFAIDDPGFTGDRRLLDTSFPGFFRLGLLSLPLASSLTLVKDRQPDARLVVHARSTPQSARLVDDAVSLAPLSAGGAARTWPQPRAFAQYDLVASSEGTMRRDNAAAARSSRVLVIASSQFTANPMMRANLKSESPSRAGHAPLDPASRELVIAYLKQGFERTFVAFKNILDWMGGDLDVVACGASLFPADGRAR